MTTEHNANVIATSPFNDQQPGTSGLRKPTRKFMEPHYLENFIQSTFNVVMAGVDQAPCGPVELVIGGDGRYFGREATQTIVKMAVANGLARLIVGADGLMSTPAVSECIRRRKTHGGIILTASHNPGGPDADFGVKYNTPNGGPAPSGVTERIFAESKKLSSYKICPSINIDVAKIGTTVFKCEGKETIIEIVDPVQGYLDFMRQLFDFDAMRELLASGFKVRFDSMHGVTGPYVKRILCEALGAPESFAVRANPLPDFGGSHPDPNLTYAHELVESMKTGEYDLGAAFDGDGDRNMIIGRKGFFVTPSDSLAALAANAKHIRWLRQRGLPGVARSMPTGCAVDIVANAEKIKCFEVPTGWKFFGNLMDAGLISLCGEESFGTGSDHIREKDGVWSALAWLSVLASRKPLNGVQEIVEEVWRKHGRCYFSRWDYENCASADGDKLIANLDKMIESKQLIGQTFKEGGESYTVTDMDQFSYTDPVDGSVTKRQGVRIIFSNGARLIFRLSGTGSSGATIRLYIEQPSDRWAIDTQAMLAPLAKIAIGVSDLANILKRESPTVIT